MSDNPHSLHESLFFGRPPIWDPATFLLRESLDQAVLHELAMAHLENQKALAEAQLNIIQKIQSILVKAGKR